MQNIVAEGGEFWPKREAPPEDTVDGHCEGKADCCTNAARGNSRDDGHSAVCEAEESMVHEKEREFRAENHASCGENDNESLRPTSSRRGTSLCSWEELAKGNSH